MYGNSISYNESAKVEREENCSLLTDRIELNALITQVLRVGNDVVLGLSVSDQHTNLARLKPHPNILFEIVLEDVVQSQTCNEDMGVHFSS